jgi:hypothetical protein
VGVRSVCLDSDWSTFYLLHLDVSWAQVYDTEPLANITDPAQRALVLGAEVCKWGEETDASTFDGYVWPRLAAAAETFCTLVRISFTYMPPSLFGLDLNLALRLAQWLAIMTLPERSL